MFSLDKTIIIMMGLQGSGKSEYCRQFLPSYVRVNLDTLRTRNNERTLIEPVSEIDAAFGWELANT